MGGRDQPPHERGRAQHIGVHDQQVVVEVPASKPQRIETAPVVLIVDHIPNRQAAITLPGRRSDHVLLMAHHQDSALDADLEQCVEIPDQEGPAPELEETLGAILRDRGEALADACCQDHSLHAPVFTSGLPSAMDNLSASFSLPDAFASASARAFSLARRAASSSAFFAASAFSRSSFSFRSPVRRSISFTPSSPSFCASGKASSKASRKPVMLASVNAPMLATRKMLSAN